MHCIVCSLFAVGFRSRKRPLCGHRFSPQFSIFWSVLCHHLMIRVGGRLRCCSPASFRFSVHCVVLCMVRVVLYSLQCCFTTSIRLQRVFFKIEAVRLTSLLATNTSMAKTYLCCITQVRKLSWHHGLRNRKGIATTVDSFSLSIQSYSSVVPSNLILRI